MMTSFQWIVGTVQRGASRCITIASWLYSCGNGLQKFILFCELYSEVHQSASKVHHNSTLAKTLVILYFFVINTLILWVSTNCISRCIKVHQSALKVHHGSTLAKTLVILYFLLDCSDVTNLLIVFKGFRACECLVGVRKVQLHPTKPFRLLLNVF